MKTVTCIVQSVQGVACLTQLTSLLFEQTDHTLRILLQYCIFGSVSTGIYVVEQFN